METHYSQEVQHQSAVYHRNAGNHFAMAAKLHLAAAEADDRGDVVGASHHAYLAYGHQVHAVYYSTMAAKMDRQVADDGLDSSAV